MSAMLFLSSACNKKSTKNPLEQGFKRQANIVYAKGFDIQHFKTYKKLIIRNPYPQASEHFEYILDSKPYKKESDNSVKTIRTPIQEIVVTSTAHIPMLELLGEEKSLVGFQNTKYISAEKTRKRIDSGYVKELGNKATINTEVLFELDPEVLIGFSVNKINKTYSFIERHGIPVILNGDWLEETPLGRAEWIKFFGVLFDKEKEANEIFVKIETNYLKAKAIASKTATKLTVLSGAVMNNDIWNLPAGNSFAAMLLRDANLNYLWKDTKGRGSLQLSFESVLEKAQDADLWIAPAYFSSKKQLLDANKHYKSFSTFKNNNIYTASAKTGITGGIIYYELGPTRPDLILKDLIKIANPELLPMYNLTFFEQMK